jgi:hypothetical protein
VLPTLLAMDHLAEAVAEAVEIRSGLEEFELRTYGRTWSVIDRVAGLVTDVGDLARLVGVKQGLRPPVEDVDAALPHEVADCLWAVFVIATKGAWTCSLRTRAGCRTYGRGWRLLRKAPLRRDTLLPLPESGPAISRA